MRHTKATSLRSPAEPSRHAPEQLRASGFTVDWREQPLRVSAWSCRTFDDLDPQALGLTYWFEPAAEGAAYPVTIRFSGRRIGVKGRPGPRDSFDVLETVDRVVPGSGPIAVTVRVENLSPGNWQATAKPIHEDRPRHPRSAMPSPRPDMPKASTSGTTAFAPVVGVMAPGARLGIWPALVGLGAAVALTMQGVLANRAGLPLGRVLLLSAVACLIGLVGAKLYFVTGHLIKGDLGRGLALLTGGMCIQGFVLGAVGTLAVGAAMGGIDAGRLLDVTAPGLMFGMTIGRFGCFFGGCCAGRATASRWGLWSSDRKFGMRRIPTQLLESAAALLIGLASLLAVWKIALPQKPGVVFAGAIAAYTFARQLLFPLRTGPRHTAYGRLVMLALAAIVTVLAVVMAVLPR